MTATEYRLQRERLDAYTATRERLYPGCCSFTPKMIAHVISEARIGGFCPTNEERSAVEVYEWLNNPPDKYFLYINEERLEAQTWIGDRLGKVTFGLKYRDNFGGVRVPITVKGTNGAVYHGTYYKSSGNYARIKMNKASRRTFGD